jgi:hypothetical protein
MLSKRFLAGGKRATFAPAHDSYSTRMRSVNDAIIRRVLTNQDQITSLQEPIPIGIERETS